jgi:hypothetical protein
MADPKKKPYLKECDFCAVTISMRFVGHWVAFDKNSNEAHHCNNKNLLKPVPLPITRCRDCNSPVIPGWNVCNLHRS